MTQPNYITMTRVHRQAHSYVHARGGSCLLVPRHLNFSETQINVMRNCKKKKIWQKESYYTLLFKLHRIWLVAFLENCCHQMSDFMAKLHQIWFRLGLRPRPHWGAYSAPQTL